MDLADGTAHANPRLRRAGTDITVVRGTDEDYRHRIPSPDDVSLLVEVSLTTLDQDRGKKLSAYARANIPFYWIVNLVNGQVEVYSDPGPAGYRSLESLRRPCPLV